MSGRIGLIILLWLGVLPAHSGGPERVVERAHETRISSAISSRLTIPARGERTASGGWRVVVEQASALAPLPAFYRGIPWFRELFYCLIGPICPGPDCPDPTDPPPPEPTEPPDVPPVAIQLMR